MTVVVHHTLCPVFFFFQAEDGIRDLVRSRGLGDVYKRQAWHALPAANPDAWTVGVLVMTNFGRRTRLTIAGAVSYTHLTLPTSDLV